MSVTFKASDNQTGEKSRYFFSSEDFEASKSFISRDGTCKKLSLGDSLGDWQEATSSKTETHYENLIADLPVLFADSSGVSGFSERQAEVLLGNLALYTSLRFSRSLCQLTLVPKSEAIDDSVFEQESDISFERPFSSKDAYQLLNSEQFSRLVELVALRVHFDYQEPLVLQIQGAKTPNPIKRQGLEKVYLLLQRFFRGSSSGNSISILSSYLGRLQEALLNILVFQAPSFLEIRPETTEYISRGECLTLSGAATEREASLFLLRILAPQALVENFELTLKQAHEMGFPKKPRTVFTSNGFDSDDEFKVHLANALPGAKYVVGQHGVGYGVAKTRDICPELNACDLFLSWGWSSDHEQVRPFGQLKPKVKVNRLEKMRSVTLFLRSEMFSFFLFADMNEPNNKYFGNVIQLAIELDNLGISTNLRVHGATSISRRKFLSSSIADLEHVSIANTREPLQKLLSTGVGAVFTYDSTGMLELGTSGLPFFSFMPDGLDLIRDDFLSNYEALRKEGLLSENPKIAASMISNWMNADGNLRLRHKNALGFFTEGIAHYPSDKLLSLRALLRNPINFSK